MHATASSSKPPRRALALLLTLLMGLLAFAGCLAPDSETDVASRAGYDPYAEAITLLHDHTDYSLHTSSHHVELLHWDTLNVELGANGYANFVLHEEGDRRLAYVAIDGDQEGGFDIVDITKDEEWETLGSYRAPGSGFQEVRVVPSGNYAILNVQDIPDPTAIPEAMERSCSICLHLIDVQDPNNPTLVGYLPVEILGSHNMDIVQYDDGLYLFSVGQPLDNSPVGNYVIISQLLETPLGLQALRINQFQHLAILDNGRSFPHDVLVQTHPVTGQRLAYVSHWNGGFQVWDVSQPRLPILLPEGIHTDAAPSTVKQTHWIVQEESARADGRVIAYSAPEIGVLAGSTGLIRSFDVTDPSNPTQIGTWELPGDLEILGQYILSPHVVAVHDTEPIVAVAHYHAGVWFLDVTDPTDLQPVGYYEPHGDPEQPYAGAYWWKKPNFDPEGYGPNAYMVRWDGDRVYVTDRGTGLYLLDASAAVDQVRA